MTNTADPIARLTDAQREVLRLVMAGFKSKEIAYQLGIGEDAVNKRLAAAKTALGAPSRFAAARLLAAHEAQDQSYHSPGGQFLAVEDEVPSADTGRHQPDQDLADVIAADQHQVSEARLDYKVMPDAAAAQAESARPASFPDARQLVATPGRVFLLTFLIGVATALLTRT